METLAKFLKMSEAHVQEFIDTDVETYPYIRKDAKAYLLNQSHLIRCLFVSSVVALNFTGRECAFNHTVDEKRLISYLLLYKFYPEILRKFYQSDIYDKMIIPILDKNILIITKKDIPDEDFIKILSHFLYTLDLHTIFMQHNSNNTNMFIGEKEADYILNDFVVQMESDKSLPKYIDELLNEYSKKLHETLIFNNKMKEHNKKHDNKHKHKK